MPKLPQGDFLLLVDASSYLHRAYHKLKKVTRMVDDREIGAIIGFSWSMMKLFRLNKTALGRRPRYGLVALDARGKNFRHEIYPLYKANRPGYEPGLEEQLPMLTTVADVFRVPWVRIPGFEADDIIATYVEMARREGLMTVIASSDKDLSQLVDDDVFLYDALADRNYDNDQTFDMTDSIMDAPAVLKKFGVWPYQMVDFQALTGDQVDNVPGAHQVGPKKAAELLKHFDTLDKIMLEADWGPDGFAFHSDRKIHARLLESYDNIFLSRELVTLDRHVSVPWTLDDLALQPANSYALKAFFREIESPQLERRVDF